MKEFQDQGDQIGVTVYVEFFLLKLLTYVKAQIIGLLFSTVKFMN
jgi:hypothetical protein